MTPSYGQRARDRFNAKHDRYAWVAPLDDQGVLVARHELLVTSPVADAVRQFVRDDWLDDVREQHGTVRLRFRPGTVGPTKGRSEDEVGLAEEVLSRSRLAPGLVRPNHVFRGEPAYGGGPFDDPHPAPQLPEPEGAPGNRPVRVAVVDTGIVPHYWWNTDAWFSAVSRSDREIIDRNGDDERDDQAGHGTFIAGIVLRRSPGAQIRPERCLDSFGFTTEYRLIRHLTALGRLPDDQRPHIVNLSLGGYTYDDKPSHNLNEAVARLTQRAVVVACAGNNGLSERPFWPAALADEVVAVGALTTDGAPAEWSNSGEWVDVWAVGQDVTSTFVRFSAEKFDGYATWSGTSFAAPQVTGLIAREYASSSDVTPHEARDRVLAGLPTTTDGYRAVSEP
jgi:subtilisin family serine protease